MLLININRKEFGKLLKRFIIRFSIVSLVSFEFQRFYFRFEEKVRHILCRHIIVRETLLYKHYENQRSKYSRPINLDSMADYYVIVSNR
jgi:hypothetical protein